MGEDLLAVPVFVVTAALEPVTLLPQLLDYWRVTRSVPLCQQEGTSKFTLAYTK